MSTNILKALPGKLYIKRHTPSILYLGVSSLQMVEYSWKNNYFPVFISYKLSCFVSGNMDGGMMGNMGGMGRMGGSMGGSMGGGMSGGMGSTGMGGRMGGMGSNYTAF